MLTLKDLADEADIGVLFEFLRTCANAKGDPHRHYKITPSLHLDLSRRSYKVRTYIPGAACGRAALLRTDVCYADVC
jgi:hypothetical protein